MRGLRRIAVRVAMNRTRRTEPRPPRIMRRPRSVPLSRLNGARPTRAAMRRRSNRPSSGSSAISVKAVIGPTPGTEVSRFSVSRQAGVARMVVVEIRLEVLEGALQPREVGVDPPLEAAIPGHAPAIRLSAEHLDELAAAGDEFAETVDLVGGQWADGGPHGLGKVRDDAGVEGIGLRQEAGGAGKVADLAGIDDGDGEAGAGQGGRDGGFVAAGGFQGDEGGGEGAQAARRAVSPASSWGTTKVSPVGRMCTSRWSLATSRPTKRWSMTRPCKCGLRWPERLCGFTVREVGGAPSSDTVSRDPGRTGSRPPSCPDPSY